MVSNRDACFRFAARSENCLVNPLGFIILLTEPLAAIKSEQCVTQGGESGHKQQVTKASINESRYFHYILVVSWEKGGGKKLCLVRDISMVFSAWQGRAKNVMRFADSKATQG